MFTVTELCSTDYLNVLNKTESQVILILNDNSLEIYHLVQRILNMNIQLWYYSTDRHDFIAQPQNHIKKKHTQI